MTITARQRCRLRCIERHRTSVPLLMKSVSPLTQRPIACISRLIIARRRQDGRMSSIIRRIRTTSVHTQLRLMSCQRPRNKNMRFDSRNKINTVNTRCNRSRDVSCNHCSVRLQSRLNPVFIACNGCSYCTNLSQYIQTVRWASKKFRPQPIWTNEHAFIFRHIHRAFVNAQFKI